MSIVACIAIILAATVPLPPDASSTRPPAYPSEEALRRYLQGRLLEERGAGTEALNEYYRALLLDDRAVSLPRRVSELTSSIGENERSLEFADRTLALDSTDARASWLRGVALMNLGREREAIVPLIAATRHDSTRTEYLRTLARAAERLDLLELVADASRRALWIDDTDPEVWFQLAAAEARLGRFAAADTLLVTAIDMNPLRPGMLFLKGWVAENLKRTSEARDLYRQHLRIHPDDQAARLRLIQLLVSERRRPEALREARLAASAQPDDLQVHRLYADLCFATGAGAEGMRELERMRAAHPGDPAVRAVRVDVLGRNGRARQAVDEATAWLASRPDQLQGRLLLAGARELAGDQEGSLRELRTAVAQAPDSIAPHVLLARAYQKADRYREAEAVWSGAFARFPQVNALAFDLALCREKIGDLRGAESAVRDVLRREPDNATALNFLGYLFADHNLNLDEAIQLIRRALELDPDNGAYLDSLGWALYRLGQLGEARTHLEHAVRLTGGDPVIHEHLGDVYKDLKLKDLAEQQYRLSLAAEGNPRVRAKLSGLR